MQHTMTIYKDKAIEAIWSEPILEEGRYFHSDDDIKNCAVCAVGSVLREHCFTTKTKDVLSVKDIMNGHNVGESLDISARFLFNGPEAYLANLSSVFETTSLEINTNSVEMRECLTSEISAMWPESFKITFDDYE